MMVKSRKCLRDQEIKMNTKKKGGLWRKWKANEDEWGWGRQGHAGWTLMPQHEEISLLLSVGCFQWRDDPINPSSVAEKSFPQGDFSAIPLTSTQWRYERVKGRLQREQTVFNQKKCGKKSFTVHETSRVLWQNNNLDLVCKAFNSTFVKLQI